MVCVGGGYSQHIIPVNAVSTVSIVNLWSKKYFKTVLLGDLIAVVRVTN